MLKFPQYLIYQPGVLERGKDWRIGEKIAGDLSLHIRTVDDFLFPSSIM